MVISDASAQPLPGKEAQLVAAVKEVAAYFDQHWPAALPRQVLVDLTGEVDRTHIIAAWPTLADHERSDNEQAADSHVQALFEKISGLMVPGSGHAIFRRQA
jgi:hypothetical protein